MAMSFKQHGEWKARVKSKHHTSPPSFRPGEHFWSFASSKCAVYYSGQRHRVEVSAPFFFIFRVRLARTWNMRDDMHSNTKTKMADRRRLLDTIIAALNS